MTTTIDTMRAKAEAAKAWRPLHWCTWNDIPWFDDCGRGSVEPCTKSCDECAGANRAVEDIAKEVDDIVTTLAGVTGNEIWARHRASIAARIASYFAAEPNPVSEFRDAVKEMCK